MINWVPLTEARGHVTRSGPHRFQALAKGRKGRGIPWPVCSNCGLVCLRNPDTARAQRAKCSWEENA